MEASTAIRSKRLLTKKFMLFMALGGDTVVRVDLLQHLVDVEGVRIHVLYFALLAVLSNGLDSLF